MSQKHKLIIDRIEGETVVFLDGKKQVELAKKFLPADIKEGEAVFLEITSDREETEKRHQTARELLNEILNSDK